MSDGALGHVAEFDDVSRSAALAMHSYDFMHRTDLPDGIGSTTSEDGSVDPDNTGTWAEGVELTAPSDGDEAELLAGTVRSRWDMMGHWQFKFDDGAPDGTCLIGWMDNADPDETMGLDATTGELVYCGEDPVSTFWPSRADRPTQLFVLRSDARNEYRVALVNSGDVATATFDNPPTGRIQRIAHISDSSEELSVHSYGHGPLFPPEL